MKWSKFEQSSCWVTTNQNGSVGSDLGGPDESGPDLSGSEGIGPDLGGSE